MELAARTATWSPSGAPLPYLRRVAYLEGHGQEYFDLPFKANENTHAEIECAYGNGNTQIFGARDAAISRAFCIATVDGYYPSYVDIQVGNNRPAETLHKLSNMDFHLFIIDAKSSFYDGIYITKSDGTTFETSYNLRVFGRNAPSSNVSPAKFKIIKIFDGSSLIFDLISVLDLSGRPFFYNQAPSSVPADDPSRFFYNASGTGEFTWGELET